MKIYENANDQHVRKVVLYEVSTGLAFDKAGTELLTKEQIIDAFLKGCVVENEGNYKTPTGVNVTDSGAEFVFGGGSGDGAMIVDCLYDEDALTVTSSTSFNTVQTAMLAGKNVFLNVSLRKTDLYLEHYMIITSPFQIYGMGADLMIIWPCDESYFVVKSDDTWMRM